MDRKRGYEDGSERGGQRGYNEDRGGDKRGYEDRGGDKRGYNEDRGGDKRGYEDRGGGKRGYEEDHTTERRGYEDNSERGGKRGYEDGRNERNGRDGKRRYEEKDDRSSRGPRRDNHERGHNGPEKHSFNSNRGSPRQEIVRLNCGAVKIGLEISELPNQKGHMTIMYLYPNSVVSRDCYHELAAFIHAMDRPKPGKLGYYTVKFTGMWGSKSSSNSALVDNVSALAYLQQEMFAQIYGILYKYGYIDIIEKNRYPCGLPPPHVSIRAENREACERYFHDPGVKCRIDFNHFWALTEKEAFGSGYGPADGRGKVRRGEDREDRGRTNDRSSTREYNKDRDASRAQDHGSDEGNMHADILNMNIKEDEEDSRENRDRDL